MQHSPRVWRIKRISRPWRNPALACKLLADKVVASYLWNNCFMPMKLMFPAYGTTVSRRGNCCAMPRERLCQAYVIVVAQQFQQTNLCWLLPEPKGCFHSLHHPTRNIPRLVTEIHANLEQLARVAAEGSGIAFFLDLLQSFFGCAVQLEFHDVNIAVGL